MTTARELMRPCTTVRESATVTEMVRLISSDAVPCLVVVNGQERPVGMITESDLIRLVYESGEFDTTEALVGNAPAFLGYTTAQLKALKAEDLMTGDITTVGPDTELNDVVSTMFRNEHKVLPVVDHGQLLGLVLRTDVIKLVLG